MTQDDLFRPEGDASPDKKSSGCGFRFLLILLVSVTGLSLLCCCGIGISMYSMVPKIEEDPAIAQETLDKLMTIALPEGYQPKVAVAMKAFSFINVNGVIVESASKNGILILARFRGSLIEQGDVVSQIEDAMKEQADDSDMVIESRETREYEINGQPVEFTFLKGRRNDSGDEGSEELDGEEPEVAKPVDEETNAEPPVDGDSTEEAPVAPDADTPPPPADTDTKPAEEPTAKQPDDAAAQADATEDEAGSEEDGMRQVRALIPSADGPLLFLLIVPEKEWNEQDVVDMIESIELK